MCVYIYILDMSLNRYLGQVWVKHELVVLSKFLMLQYIHVATSKCCYSKMLMMISLLIADLDLSIAYLDLSTALKELGLSL